MVFDDSLSRLIVVGIGWCPWRWAAGRAAVHRDTPAGGEGGRLLLLLPTCWPLSQERQ